MVARRGAKKTPPEGGVENIRTRTLDGLTALPGRCGLARATVLRLRAQNQAPDNTPQRPGVTGTEPVTRFCLQECCHKKITRLIKGLQTLPHVLTSDL